MADTKPIHRTTLSQMGNPRGFGVAFLRVLRNDVDVIGTSAKKADMVCGSLAQSGVVALAPYW